MKVIVSACLLGENCKYDGGNNYTSVVADYIKGKEVIPVCPEMLAGLGCPRTPIEIVDGVVMDCNGHNVDNAIRGAVAQVMEALKKEEIQCAILQSRSPTCGVNQIYDGSFSRKRITGSGVFAQALKDAGYQVIDVEDIGSYPANRVVIITTGSQGEPMSALYRMAFSDHNQVELTSGDLVVLSSHAIPGNEKLVGNIINEMYRRGVNVYHEDAEVHVSGHACQEEIKLLHALVKPKYFMPIHGEYSHLMQHKELAEYMGMNPNHIFVCDIGQVLELDKNSCKKNGTVPSGRVLVDGYGVGDVGNIVLRDRRHLAQDGLIVVVATVDTDTRTLLSGPDIISRGFVYVRESEQLMEDVRNIAKDSLMETIDAGVAEWTQMKQNIKGDLSKYLYSKTKRKPMILPVIMNV